MHIYGRGDCPYCSRAERLLARCGVKMVFHDVRNPTDLQRLGFMMEERGIVAKSVPQIFFCKEHIGGYSDLSNLRKGKALNKALDDNKVQRRGDCDGQK